MRQFRFRAWHKGYDRPNVKTPIKPQMLYDDRYGDCIQWKIQGQPLIVMQDTGLHDKHNTPVYEGDILVVPHFLDKNGWRYLHHVVEWSDKYSGWWCRNVTSDHDADGNIQLWVYAKKEFEVVGNIYETPELLTK